MNRICTYFFAVALTLASGVMHATPMLYSGTIQFPGSLAAIPSVRVYFCGTKVQTEQFGKSVFFSIPEDRQRLSFWLLITENLSFEQSEGNTINHLQVDQTKPYKLYRLTLHKKEQSPEDLTKNQQADYAWRIEEKHFSKNNVSIPDDAIIVYYNANYVTGLEGGNAIELPKIIIRPDILAFAGSEEKLHEKSISLILSSLDYDTMHANPQRTLSHDATGSRIVSLTT